ncbi:hypothetical protein [Rothia aeria]|uniref:hypothetical protein n=1 Tax=Rothia aeria TaxID=172042 RepID=UPI00241DFB74|nr:hypothetical protein [Rothia aeria]
MGFLMFQCVSLAKLGPTASAQRDAATAGTVVDANTAGTAHATPFVRVRRFILECFCMLNGVLSVH